MTCMLLIAFLTILKIENTLIFFISKHLKKNIFSCGDLISIDSSVGTNELQLRIFHKIRKN